MSYTALSIPGCTTSYEGDPVVRISAVPDGPVSLIVDYCASYIEDGPLYGEITFSQILEYKFQVSFVDYEDFPEHSSDYEIGPIEIHQSAYIENMASRGVNARFHGHRFGQFIEEAEVKHYRLGFDDYGRFDVICFGASAKVISESEYEAARNR
jgi:hypothetical protein